MPFPGLQQSVDDDLKMYKQRDLSQTYFFKVASRTFGPPKSRRRCIIAPPMENCELREDTKIILQEIPSNKTISDIEKATNQERDVRQERADWISERRKLRAQLDSMGDLKTWLQGKPLLTELETLILDRITEETPKSPVSQVTSQDMDTEHFYPKSPPCRRSTPSIRRPHPDALGILDHYLHRSRLRLVDLYNQTDKSKMKKISSQDLKAVRKEANMPISDLQFDDLVISLSKKNPNVINYKELSRGRDSWRKEKKEERKTHRSSKSVSFPQHLEDIRKVSTERPLSPGISGSFDLLKDTRAESATHYSESSRSQFLQVPPVNLEEKRPLTYEDMEEIGKMYRERRRRGMSNTRLLDWLEKCRVVRTGNTAVDGHSLPSTLGDEMGETVEQYRRQDLQQYYKILKLCQSYRVPLSEKLLERALLYPGDKLICDAGQHLNFRQPGRTPLQPEYIYGRQQVARAEQDRRSLYTQSEDTRSSSILSREPCTPDARVSQAQAKARDDTQDNHNTGEMFIKPAQIKEKSGAPYPPNSYVRRVRAKVRGSKKAEPRTLNCWTTFEQFQEMSRNLKRRFPHIFLTTDYNAFWPGQVLDKLCIYLPKVAQKDTKLPSHSTD
ncbi:EF-hand calcium-binding domain-containing protein 12 [Bombina bombina]|uniref:EF-hand calcium-binding domain-containing protein 12 n=1 Tax=Bombina bombina TaxID=8345 RepID=UPI00235A8224|nr:EF-hand calcium-binding domain-containing protein 12 [Bombina bombina]